MAAVISLLIGVAAVMYVGPKVAQVAWMGGPTWVGKTALTWGVLAVVYDMFVNTEQGDAFDTQDVAITGIVTLLLRGGLNQVM